MLENLPIRCATHGSMYCMFFPFTISPISSSSFILLIAYEIILSVSHCPGFSDFLSVSAMIVAIALPIPDIDLIFLILLFIFPSSDFSVSGISISSDLDFPSTSQSLL